MNEEDEILSVRRLRTTRESSDRERLAPQGRAVKPSMSDEASLGLRLVGEEISEESCAQRTRKKIRRGIVWQVAYDVPSDLIVRSSAVRPYTH
jgi:hypothetical protein